MIQSGGFLGLLTHHILIIIAAFLFHPRLDPVITDVPLYELPQPGGQVRGGFVPEVVQGQAHIRMRVRHVTVSGHLYHMLLRLRVQQPFQNRHQVTDRDRRRVAQIVDSQLGRAFLFAAAPGALLGRVESPETAFDYVVNVREVTRHLFVVDGFVHVNGFAL